MADTDRTIRFVVLSTARSGTSLLTSTLNQHPDVYCHGEIFHPRPEIHIRDEFRAQADLGARERDPVSFTYSLLDFSNGMAAVGFKMWRAQSEPVCDALLSDRSLKKIILERQNKLAQFSSGTLAKTTGVWNLRAGRDLKVVNGAKATFSSSSFRKFLARNSETYRHYHARAVGPVLDLDYAQLAGIGLAPVLEFIGVPVVALSATKARLHSSDILSRFDERHHDEIVSLLDEIGSPEWRYEDVRSSSPGASYKDGQQRTHAR